MVLALTPRLDSIVAGTQGFVDESALINVPYTTIVGRAQIPDIANDLKASLGIERIPVQQIIPLQNEFGPNGEPVYGALNDARGLIRFVGGWQNTRSSWAGACVESTGTSGATDYVEVVFYGTGLDILTAVDTSSRTYIVTLDGVAYSTPTITGSAVLATRTSAPNNIIPIVTGQTLGIHTVKIQVNASPDMILIGFEVLNHNASGLININPGVVYNKGAKYTNSAADSVAYATGYTPASNSDKGARIVRYISADDTLSQAVTMVDTDSYRGASATHTNEELARKYHIREFGAGRSDLKDFSLTTYGTSDNYGFILEDGVTALTCYQCWLQFSAGDYIEVRDDNSSFFTFTFVGTGLDIEIKETATGTESVADQVYYSVDGESYQNWFYTVGNTSKRIQKIVSGLPYGTHTFRLKRGSPQYHIPVVYSFLVYQPKKPSLPTGAVEIADYNVMADYLTSTVNGAGVSRGVLRKSGGREFVYSGSWGYGGVDAEASGGAQMANTVNGSYSEYTFFGTGFETLWRAHSGLGNNVLVSLQNLSAGGSLQTLRKTNFPGLTTGSNGGGSFTYDDTGVWSQYNATSVYGSRIYVSGLTLGMYRVRFTNQTSSYQYQEAFDIITPIHTHKSNLYGVLQNTLPVGSCSMLDTRATSYANTQKAWAQAVGIASGPTTGSTTRTPCPDMSVTIETGDGEIEISYSATYQNSNSSGFTVAAIVLDGVLISSNRLAFSNPALNIVVAADSVIWPVCKGAHKVDVYWACSAATSSAYGTDRTLKVREI